VPLLQESLSVAHKTGAIATKDLERVVVDTTRRTDLHLAAVCRQLAASVA
jgi:hypothetical protein